MVAEKKEKREKQQISTKNFVRELKSNKLGPIVEVPCSYLKDFLNYVWDNDAMPILNPANEAVVMALAAGEYMGGKGKRIPIVAVQNSGFMNTLNALTSLHQMYNIPAFMMVTWRGEGGVGKDAPEHDITGGNLLKYLKMLELPYEIADPKTYQAQVKRLADKTRETKKPVVLVIRKDTFEPYKKKKQMKESKLQMTRYDAVEVIKKEIDKNVHFLTGTGFPTRDAFNVKDTPDFYTMGSMGHVAGMGLSVARNEPKKKIVVLDGDGGALMHAGTFASLDPKIHKNYMYIMLDNEVFESTGGQPAPSQNVDFQKFSETFGFGRYVKVETKSSLARAVRSLVQARVPIFLHVKIKPGDHAGRRVSEDYSCSQVTERFIKSLQN